MRSSLLSTALMFVLAACQSQPVTPTSTPPVPTNPPLATETSTATAMPSPTAASELRLSLPQLQNAAYHSQTWGDFQLSDGIFYRPPATQGEAPQLYATGLILSSFGDLNGDGFQDAVAILQTHNGGNGDTKELALLLDQDGQAVNLATVEIGSMIAVETVEIRAGVVQVELRVQGPGDALCCPSQKETRRFQLENNQLIQIQP